MISSIRAFLVVNLLLSLTLITSLSVVGNLFLEHKHMQSRVDSRLMAVATRLDTYIEKGILESLSQKQKAKLVIPLLHATGSAEHQVSYFKPDYSLIQYQVWDRNGQLILRSNGAPKQAMSIEKSGFETIALEGATWRVFQIKNLKSGVIISVGESYEFLQALESRITQDSILIMLITYPLLAILIWVIVGRAFDSVNRLSKKLTIRFEKKRQPIDASLAPKEIEPFITELNHLLDRLQNTIDREKRFASDAAHELKTPLAALKTQAQVALHSQNDNERIRAIKNLILSVDRSTHVVQQLLTMSKMVPESTLNDVESIDLSKIVRESAAELAEKAFAKQTDLEVHCQPGQSMMINGNTTAIRIMLRNLIDNAIRYSPNNSQVQIMLNRKVDHIELTVVDNGPGIPEELRERVFERFFRVVGNQSTGSGLGLGIVKQIADLHHAELQLGAPKNHSGLKVVLKFPLEMPIKAL